MTRNDIIASLIAAGLYGGRWVLDDIEYAPVGREFVFDARREWINSFPLDMLTTYTVGGTLTIPTPIWVPEAGDCDNIARDFAWFMSRCEWFDTIRAKRNRGNMAAGKLNYSPTPDTGHAINWWVDHEGLAHVIDAATLAIDHLTDEQKSTISEGESC